MATIKSYTDLEQSKALAKFLPLESADNYYSWHDEHYYIVNKDCPYPYSLKEKIPCWSLAALLEVFPKIEHLKPFIDLSPKLNSEEVAIYYHSEDSPYIVRDNPVDACVAMIEKLHEQNLL